MEDETKTTIEVSETLHTTDSVKSKNEESPLEEKVEDKWLMQSDGTPWLDSEGNKVPKKCPKCGADVGVFIQGEPVFLCTGKDKHYLGTVKFPSKEEASTDEQTDSQEEVSSEETKSSQKENPIQKYKLMVDMLREMDNYYKSIRETYESSIENYDHIRKSALTDIVRYSKEDIKEMSLEDMDNFLSSHMLPEYKKLDEDKTRELMNHIKDNSVTLFNAREEVVQNHKEADEILSEYFNYLNSDKALESRKKYLNKLKEALEEEKDEKKKEELSHTIDSIQQSMNFSFILKRLNDYGEEEEKRIIKNFFDSRLSSYTLKRFQSHIKKFGYKDSVINHFFNIEETFLPEEYHPFNNLFLFIYTSFVAYANRYDHDDTLFVQSITGAMADLFYHRFVSTEQEKQFVSVIKEVDDRFMNYKDYFSKNNETYKNHPNRQALEKGVAKKRHALIISQLHNIGVDDFDENDTTENLHKLYDETINKYVARDKTYDEELKKQQKEENKEKEEVTNNVEESEMSDTPTIASVSEDNTNNVNYPSEDDVDTADLASSTSSDLSDEENKVLEESDKEE